MLVGKQIQLNMCKYGPTELEVATLVFSLEHIQVYLLGNKVTVFTNHQALVSAYIPYLNKRTFGKVVFKVIPILAKPHY